MLITRNSFPLLSSLSQAHEMSVSPRFQFPWTKFWNVSRFRIFLINLKSNKSEDEIHGYWKINYFFNLQDSFYSNLGPPLPPHPNCGTGTGLKIIAFKSKNTDVTLTLHELRRWLRQERQWRSTRIACL